MHALKTAIVGAPRPANSAPLLTEREAAEFLGVSTRCLQDKRLRGGGCPYVKIGRLVRYRTEDITAFVEACRRSHTSEVR